MDDLAVGATAIAAGLGCLVAAHVLLLTLLSSRWSKPAEPVPSNLTFAFVIPCLNEEQVITATVASLLALDWGQIEVVVVDDDSDDRTAAALQAYDQDERVTVLRRYAPHARQGKGHALNAAFKHLQERDWGDREPIVCVMDADGRLGPGALGAVGPYFADPGVGAVQVGVRIRNAASSVLARMQDIEFVIFTDVFQTGRNRLSSPSLGGNGQFVRLAALADLGDEPWSSCLTEDLEVGLRLVLAGHHLRHCPTTWVDQQGLTSVRRWVRQRTRWFQGHVQCAAYAGAVWRSDLGWRTRADLIFHLFGPGLVLVASVAVVAGWVAALSKIAAEPGGLAPTLLGLGGVQTYLLAFAPSPLVAWAIWRRDAALGLATGVAVAHLYVLYSCLWFVSGWNALIRTARGQVSWAKTARLAEVPSPQAAPATVLSRSESAPILRR